jgi:hypothetical protein
MIIRKVLPALFILFLPCFLFAQRVKVDYAKADTLAKHIKYDNDLVSLTKQLTSPFPEQVLKVRAIFRWITENIAYDFKFYNKYYYNGKEPKAFSCEGDSMECQIKLRVWEAGYISKVLDKKKAVCQGYSMLFKKMCDIAGIQSEIISGYVRTEYYEVGTPGDLDHAWNAVLLNGDYYLVDATWAAGGCTKDDDGKLTGFHKHFKEYYWLTPAAEFARNHFPEDPKWVLLAHYPIEKFSANPYYEPAELSYIKLITPASGIITAKKGDTIHFKLAYAGYLRNLQINSNIFQNPDTGYWEDISRRKKMWRLDSLAIKKQQYIKYKRNGDNYEFAYVVKDYSLDYLDIMFDTRRVMRFKVRVHG